jgi:penicillin-binding protein 2
VSEERSIASDISCWVTAGVFILGLVFLGVKLKEVQIEDSADYRYANSRQSVRRVQLGGVRGRILDRHGDVLAGNRSSLSISVDVAAFQKRTWSDTVKEVANAVSNAANIIGRPVKISEKAIKRHVNQSLAMPLVVWRDIDDVQLARFCEHEKELPGFSAEETEEREYPFGSMAAHVIGYVGRDRGEAVAGDEKFNFYQPEMRGRSGLELYYDHFLRGVPGERKVIVDARGFMIRSWTVVEPGRGPDLRLTLDARIQRAVERQLKGEKGACVVMDPQNGELLAVASAPTFNPNIFVPRLSQELYASYADDPGKPLLNRALGGAYAPGSTFKPVTALAGLRAGFPARRLYECVGYYDMGGMKLRCSARWGHGALDMRGALMKSCNPYFCNLAYDIGTNQLISAARDLGLGAKTGIDFGIDMAGTVPDAQWKSRMYRERWYSGDLLQMSIGQGMLLASPLQMARLAGAIGTGYLVVPRLKADQPCERVRVNFTDAQLAVVREGMRMVVDGGTGRRGGDGVSVPVSGKTGTAEVGKGESRRKNAWFIAYAPSENPMVAVAMVVENGDSGGGTAAPKVCEILKEVFNDR